LREREWDGTVRQTVAAARAFMLEHFDDELLYSVTPPHRWRETETERMARQCSPDLLFRIVNT
jgi:hypothetical protein